MIEGAAGKLFSQVAAGSPVSAWQDSANRDDFPVSCREPPFIHPGADRCDGLPGPFLGGHYFWHPG